MKSKLILISAMLVTSIAVSAQTWSTGTSSLYVNPTSTKVGIGVTNPQYKLDVRGTIRANEILVNTVSGADFVFDKDYNLRPLSEVNTYIQENRHLPEIPSATEMQENGVSLDKMAVQLLQKVEELTLYIIQLEQRIQEMDNRQQTNLK